MAEYESGLSRAQVQAAFKALKTTLEEWRNQESPKGIEETWRLFRLDGWAELAAFDCGDVEEAQTVRIRGHATRYVTSSAEAAEAVRAPLGQRGHYVVPAKLKAGVEATADVGTWSRARTTAKEKDVLRSFVLVVDCDPERPPNTSSTTVEWMASVGTAGCVIELLKETGVIEGALGIAHSGNGAHAHIYLDVEWSPEIKQLRARVLKALERLCGYGGRAVTVKVDQSMADGARYVPVYGTMKRKGGRGHADRPWRRTAISGPTRVTPLDLEGLRALASALEAKSGTQVVVARHSEPARVQERGTASSVGHPPANLLERATRYAAKCPVAVAGERGHATAFRVVCNVVRGFDLDMETALMALAGWNSRCSPPWSEPELRHKITDARTSGQRPELGAFLRPPKRQTLRQLPVRAPGPAAPEQVRESDWNADARPVIRLGVDTDRVVEEAVAALARDPEVYARGTVLVRAIRRDSGFELCDLPASVLRLVHLARVASWQICTEKGPVETKTPADVAKAIHELQVWPGLRGLIGIVDAPMMRRDGTVLDLPGYDEATRLLYAPQLEFGELAKEPTFGDARSAVGRLLEIVGDFPLMPSGRATWLGLVLSYFGRPMFAGPTPGFVLDANVRGCGKGLLADVTGVLCTGARLPVTTPSSDEEELRKRITSTLMGGRGLVLVDNLPNDGELGNATWDRLLTGSSWEDRVLGESTLVTLPNHTLWLYSGNNVQLRGDTTRRVLHIRLETPLERPEQRKPSEFRHDNLLGYVESQRVALVRDTLTMLRAWVVAGRPRGTVTLGSYEDWCGTIAASIEWLGLGDITKTQDEYRARTAAGAGDAAPLRPLMAAWRVAVGAAEITAARVLSMIRDEDERIRREQRRPDRASVIPTDENGDVGLDDEVPVHRYQELREALLGFAPTRAGTLPTPSWLGRKLGGALHRVVDGRRFEAREDRDGVNHWRLVDVDATTPGGENRAPAATLICDSSWDTTRQGVCGFSAGLQTRNAPAGKNAERPPAPDGGGVSGGISPTLARSVQLQADRDWSAPAVQDGAREEETHPLPPHRDEFGVSATAESAGANSVGPAPMAPLVPAAPPRAATTTMGRAIAALFFNGALHIEVRLVSGDVVLDYRVADSLERMRYLCAEYGTELPPEDGDWYAVDGRLMELELVPAPAEHFPGGVRVSTFRRAE